MAPVTEGGLRALVCAQPRGTHSIWGAAPSSCVRTGWRSCCLGGAWAQMGHAQHGLLTHGDGRLVCAHSGSLERKQVCSEHPLSGWAELAHVGGRSFGAGCGGPQMRWFAPSTLAFLRPAGFVPGRGHIGRHVLPLHACAALILGSSLHQEQTKMLGKHSSDAHSQVAVLFPTQGMSLQGKGPGGHYEWTQPSLPPFCPISGSGCNCFVPFPNCPEHFLFIRVPQGVAGGQPESMG